jgi:hypothetical protein
VVSIATQTETQRKAAAKKAAATRQRNAANRSRSAKRAAETRAKAQQTRLEAFGLQAQRVADTAIGGVVSIGETIGDTARRWTSRRDAERELRRLRGQATSELRKVERRGTTARRRAGRELARRRRSATSAVSLV